METNEKKTVKEIIDEAYSKGLLAILESLSENRVDFDDCNDGIYIDDPAEKKTYFMSIKQIECDEYGGEC